MAVSENIFQLNEYRCSNIHFAEKELDPIIFMLLSQTSHLNKCLCTLKIQ